MKTSLLFGLFLVCAFSTVCAQKREIQEVKIGGNSYKVITIESEKGKRSVWIEKATDSLLYLDPGYQWQESMEIKYDRSDMESLVKEYIAPVVKQARLSFDDKETLFMSIIFDLNGNMKEITINFPGNLDIPMTVVDDFFNAVLSSGIKCTYKKGHLGLKKARFIYVNDVIKLKELQE